MKFKDPFKIQNERLGLALFFAYFIAAVMLFMAAISVAVWIGYALGWVAGIATIAIPLVAFIWKFGVAR